MMEARPCNQVVGQRPLCRYRPGWLEVGIMSLHALLVQPWEDTADKSPEPWGKVGICRVNGSLE